MNRNNSLPEIRYVTITVVTSDKHQDSLQAEALARVLMDTDCNVTHRILLTGYRDE